MKIEFDADENLRNIAERGIDFTLAEQFEWQTALIREDDRYDYGETRYCALGYIDLRIYQLVFTLRGDIVRVISLRKANKREVSGYAKT